MKSVNENIPPVRDYYKWLKISKDATHDEIFEAIMKVKEKCGYDEDNPMPAFWESDRAPLKWKDIRDARILLDPVKRAEYDAKLDLYISSKQKVSTYDTRVQSGLNAEKDNQKIEKAKKRIANDFKQIVKIIIVAAVACILILIPGIRNGLLGLIGNPITFVLGVIVFICVATVLGFIAVNIYGLLISPILGNISDISKQRKQIKELKK